MSAAAAQRSLQAAGSSPASYLASANTHRPSVPVKVSALQPLQAVFGP